MHTSPDNLGSRISKSAPQLLLFNLKFWVGEPGIYVQKWMFFLIYPVIAGRSGMPGQGVTVKRLQMSCLNNGLHTRLAILSPGGDETGLLQMSVAT